MPLIDCNFGKVVMREVTNDIGTHKMNIPQHRQQRIHQYNTIFQAFPKMCIPSIHQKTPAHFGKFNHKVQEMLKTFYPVKFPSPIREEFLQTFSLNSWEKLAQSKKETHSFSDCRGCYFGYHSLHVSYPSSCRGRPQKMQNKATPTPSKLCTATSKTSIASHYFKEAQEKFSKITGCDKSEFEDYVCNAELGIVKKLSESEKKREKIASIKKIKSDMQDHINKIDILRPYKNRESLSQYENITRSEYLVKTTKSRKRRHTSKQTVPNIEQIQNKLEALPLGTKVNWQNIGRQHGIMAANAGQVVKEHLTDKGFDFSHLQNCITRVKNVEYKRRSKKKITGTNISVPAHLPVKKVRAGLKEIISQGIIHEGLPCTEVTMTKPKISATGCIVQQEEQVQSRAIPLHTVRTQILRDHDSLGILRKRSQNEYKLMSKENLIAHLTALRELPNEECSEAELREVLIRVEHARMLAIWNDHSTVQNHGYQLYEINAIYDPAIFLTDEEYLNKCGVQTSVASLAERPYIYMLAQIGDSTEEQMLMVDYRLKDIGTLDTPVMTTDDVVYHDVLRLHKGDHPQLQLECGITIGGEYSCVVCPTSRKRWRDIPHVLANNIRDLSDICEVATSARMTSIPGLRSSVRHLTKLQIQDELQERELQYVDKLSDLQHRLKSHRQGVEGVPLILLSNPQLSLQSCHLANLEIAPVEPLHTSKGHITNVFHELSHHTSKKLCSDMKAFTEAVFSGKQQLRGRDYRSALDQLPDYLFEAEQGDDVVSLADSLKEVVSLMYLDAGARSPVTILRTINQVFKHLILIKEVIEDPKQAKLFGHYYHDLVHLPLTCRIIAPSSLDAERQEAVFSKIKDIANTTSSHKVEHIVPNTFVRLQAEAMENTEPAHYTNSKIGKTFGIHNTTFPHHWLEKYQIIMQHHAQLIPDYLIMNEGTWWHMDNSGDIVYHDSLCMSHNFNLSSHNVELKYLKL